MKTVVSYQKLSELCRQGLSQKKIAKHLKVDPSTICKALKKFKLEATKVTALERAGEVVDAEVQVLKQLSDINQDTRNLLDELRKKKELPERTLYLKTISEIRQQIRLCVDILESLSNMKEVKQFQQDVIEAIGEADPITQRRIYERLEERRLSRTTLQYN